jgi:hypothetical protein
MFMFALRSTVSCNVLPADPSNLIVTWPLIETLCCRFAALLSVVSLFFHVGAQIRSSVAFARCMTSTYPINETFQDMLSACFWHPLCTGWPAVCGFNFTKICSSWKLPIPSEAPCRLAQRASTGAAPPFFSRCLSSFNVFCRAFCVIFFAPPSRLSVSMCMLLIKVCAPYLVNVFFLFESPFIWNRYSNNLNICFQDTSPARKYATVCHRFPSHNRLFAACCFVNNCDKCQFVGAGRSSIGTDMLRRCVF